MKNTIIRKRTTTDIQAGAEDGHIGDKYTLSKWHLEGKFSLDKNKKLSDELLEQIHNEIQGIPLYFTSLTIHGFKGVVRTKGDIELDKNLNVFVGMNGCGKTTLLEGLTKSFSWIVNTLKSGSNGQPIKKYQINTSSNIKDCFINSKIKVGDKSTFEIGLAKSKVEDSSKARSHLEEFKKLGSLYADINSKYKNVCLPIFVFYPVERALDVSYVNSKFDTSNVKPVNKLDAYEDCFGELGNYKKILEWLIYNRSPSDDNNDKIKNELSKFNFKLEQLIETKSLFTDELLASEIGIKLINQEHSLNSHINNLKLKITNEVGIIELVKHAISRFMGIDNIRTTIDEESVQIVFDRKGVAISASDLSHGEKSLFALVTDITRRLYLLNPNQKGYEALNGRGVVLIDEIEVHLHPGWQQSVVPKLMELFKNIQFIMTTHSPQVVTTIPEECIKIINNINGELEFTQPDFSFGAESNIAMNDIFGIKARPDSLDIVKKLERFKELIIQDKWDSEESQLLETELNDWANDLDPIMKRLRMDITLRKRRRGL
ncbi:AAA family ATPase [Shewanella sp. A14]